VRLRPDRPLGLAPATWRTGLQYGAASAAGIAGVVALAAALPQTRSAFLDSRYRNKPADALRYAFVTVPLQTVVPEEIAFRGVLLALLRRHYGPRRAAIASSVLFGLWHIPSSLDLAKDNEALSSRLGAGLPAEILGVAGAVVATAADCTIAEVNEIVEIGVIEPEQVGTPGLFIQSVVQGYTLIEQEAVFQELWTRGGILKPELQPV